MIFSAASLRFAKWCPLRSIACVGGTFLIFWLASACQNSCGSGNQQPILYVDGKIHTSADGLSRIYESTPFDGEWLHFPSYRRFKLQHNLGTVDYSPQMYIAFGSNPIPANGDAGDVALASGDVALIENLGSCSMQVLNNTCSEQYLYVRIQVPVAIDTGLDAGGCAP